MVEPSSTAQMREALPEQVFGYRVIARLGRGASADIYAVRDGRTGEVFAIKHVARNRPGHRHHVALLQSELEKGRLVCHPSLRAIHRLEMTQGENGEVGEAALVMEHVDGAPLRRLPGLGIGQTLVWFGQLAQALAAMHRMQVVHCDVKPGNVLVGAENIVKLIDLGQACFVGTRKQKVQGTPGFMAPEQIRRQPITPKADIYGFGATLYWALTGELVPAFDLGRAMRRQAVVPPAKLNGRVPQAVSELVMACIAAEEAKRPESMALIAPRLELMGMATYRPVRVAAGAR